jgi:hypothetical protein
MNLTGELPRACERGGARLTLLLALAVLAALVYVGGQFGPAKYHAWEFERFVQDTVNTAVSTGKPPAWVEQQLRQSFEEHGVPEDAAIEVAREGKRMKASVRYTVPISLLVTEYEYDFDVTVRSWTTTDGSV